MRGAVIGDPEVKNLIGHQQYAMPRGLFPQKFEKARTRLDHPDTERIGINQNRGEFVFVPD